MSDQSYLIFELSDASYGLSTDAVQGIFSLPEVNPTVETAPGVIGIINLRGEILPVVDLHWLLGQSSPPLQLTDTMIVVQWQGQRVGIIVQQVCEVQAIATTDIQVNLPYHQTAEHSAIPLTTGIATLDSKLVSIINPNAVIQSDVLGSGASRDYAQIDSNGANLLVRSNASVYRHKTALSDHLSVEARRQLQARADHLRQKITTQDEHQRLSLAVLKLEGEYFGVGLELVHELIDIQRLTPIPCCPPHILGNMNLRGEIITLIDISHVLNLPNHSLRNRRKAIVAQWQDSNIGIAVDDIVDVTELDPAQILAVPVAHQAMNDEYLQGVTSYQDGMMSIINLSKIITADSLVVNEEI